MKKIIFILVAFVSITTVYAQQPAAKKTTGQNNKKYDALENSVSQITEKLNLQLTLADNVLPEIKAVTLNRKKQINDARVSFGTNVAEFNKAKKTIIESWEVDIKAIITEAQYNKYMADKEARKLAKEQKKPAPAGNINVEPLF